MNKGQVFLQQAETVRLAEPLTAGEGAGARWKPLSVTDVQGEELLLIREVSKGTHIGRVIDAVVMES